MAVVKLHGISVSESKALNYIANPEKTDNGRLIYAMGCSTNPNQASRDFEQIRQTGTGRNKILSHHMIQSFAPGEITPEEALEVGKQTMEKLTHNEYQYLLCVHNDREHIHVHCIFNNVNLFNGLTFETNEDQGNVHERAWKKLRDRSDEVCKENGYSVIENPELGKGKSYFEWDMKRHGLSWKAKSLP